MSGNIDHLLWRNVEVDIVTDVVIDNCWWLFFKFVDLALWLCFCYCRCKWWSLWRLRLGEYFWFWKCLLGGFLLFNALSDLVLSFFCNRFFEENISTSATKSFSPSSTFILRNGLTICQFVLIFPSLIWPEWWSKLWFRVCIHYWLLLLLLLWRRVVLVYSFDGFGTQRIHINFWMFESCFSLSKLFFKCNFRINWFHFFFNLIFNPILLNLVIENLHKILLFKMETAGFNSLPLYLGPIANLISPLHHLKSSNCKSLTQALANSIVINRRVEVDRLLDVVFMVEDVSEDNCQNWDYDWVEIKEMLCWGQALFECGADFVWKEDFEELDQKFFHVVGGNFTDLWKWRFHDI